MISTIIATQKFDALHPMFRVNATELFVYRLSNMKGFDTCIGEVAAVVDKNTLINSYLTASSEPYSLLCVKLTTRDRRYVFQNFDKVLKTRILNDSN